MSALTEAADRIDPRAAQLVVARILAVMGTAQDWGGDEIQMIDGILQPIIATSGLPPINEFDDDDAYNYWHAVRN